MSDTSKTVAAEMSSSDRRITEFQAVIALLKALWQVMGLVPFAMECERLLSAIEGALGEHDRLKVKEHGAILTPAQEEALNGIRQIWGAEDGFDLSFDPARVLNWVHRQMGAIASQMVHFSPDAQPIDSDTFTALELNESTLKMLHLIATMAETAKRHRAALIRYCDLLDGLTPEQSRLLEIGMIGTYRNWETMPTVEGEVLQWAQSQIRKVEHTQATDTTIKTIATTALPLSVRDKLSHFTALVNHIRDDAQKIDELAELQDAGMVANQTAWHCVSALSQRIQMRVELGFQEAAPHLALGIAPEHWLKPSIDA